MISFGEFLIWESTEGMISKVPILFDKTDLEFLVGADPNWGSFPAAIWKQALKWRYNQGIIQSIESKNKIGDIKNVNGVLLPGSRRSKGSRGSRSGNFLFFDVHLGQKELFEKLGTKPNRAKISQYSKENKLSSYDEPRRYGYDLSDVVTHKNNPLSFAKGMPLMQDQASVDALSSWIYGTYYKILGEWPDSYQGKPVILQKIEGWANYKIDKFPSINKNYKFAWIPDEGEWEIIEYKDHPVPILLPGKFVPIKEGEYQNIETPKYGFSASRLMRSAGKMTDQELEHFKKHNYGPEHFLARHPDVLHKKFYVIGGWSPTNLQKGENPLFTDEDELNEFLNKKYGSKTYEEYIKDQAKEGVENFLNSVKYEPEGIVMELMFDDIVEGAKEHLLKNLGDPHLGPIEYKDGKEVININKNSGARVRNAYDYAKSIHQTNISLIGGTRRQRERWAKEGKPEFEGSAPLVTGKGSRRWVNLTSGVEAGKGWIGSSIRYMQKQMEELEEEAKEKEREADTARNIEIKIAARRDAISSILEKLLKKQIALQATYAAEQGLKEDDITINRDVALAKALNQLPSELEKLNISHNTLPKDVLRHFQQYEGWEGKVPAMERDNKGVKILHNLIEKGTAEINGREISIENLATDEELYNSVMNYVNNVKEISDLKEQKDIELALIKFNFILNKIKYEKKINSSRNEIVQTIKNPDNLIKIINDPKFRKDLIEKLNAAYAQHQVSKDDYDKLIQFLIHFNKYNEVAGATFAVMGAKPKVKKKRTYNIEGAPGGLGLVSAEKCPIGVKKC